MKDFISLLLLVSGMCLQAQPPQETLIQAVNRLSSVDKCVRSDEIQKIANHEKINYFSPHLISCTNNPAEYSVITKGKQGVSKYTGSGPNIARYANAIVTLLVDRAQREIRDKYVNQLVDALGNPYVERFLPLSSFSVANPQIKELDYRVTLNNLKSSFSQDLYNLPQSISDFARMNPALSKDSAHLVVSEWFSLVTAIQKEIPFPVYLEDFDASSFNVISTEYAHFIGLIKVASSALMNNTDTSNYYVEQEELDTIFSNDLKTDLFLGLLTSQLYSSNLEKYADLLNDKDKKASHKTIVLDCHSAFHRTALTDKKNYTNRLDSSSALITDYLLSIHHILDLYINIDKYYSTELESNESFIRTAMAYKMSLQFIHGLSVKNYTRSILAVIQNLDLLSDYTADERLKSAIHTVSKYGPLLASLIESKDADELAQVLDYYILPVGSYKNKREKRFSIELGSYFGLSYRSKTPNVARQLSENDGWRIFAPIGVNISAASKAGGSASLFISPFDLGSIAALGFSNDEAPTTLYFNEIFTPSVLVMAGLPRSPISFHIGYQWSPFFRSNSNNPEQLVISRSGHASMGLSVDIPLLQIK